MWDRLLAPGLHRVNAPRERLWDLAQEALHQAVRARPGLALVCDGEHGFNPYDYAELNLRRGAPADAGARRVLTKRALTAFQWGSLHRHVERKLLEAEAAVVVAAPYDRLFLHEELQEWEAEDYLRANTRALAGLAERHAVPVLALLDLPRLWAANPTLAQGLEAEALRKWNARPEGDAWLLTDEAEGAQARPWRSRPGTLDAFLPAPAPPPVVLSPAPKARPGTLHGWRRW